RGAVTTTRLIPDRRRIEVIDSLSRKSAVDFDAGGRPLVATGPTGLQARFTYDYLGRLASPETPGTGTTRVHYPGDTRLPVLVAAPSGRLSFTYDSRRNLLRMSHDRDKALDTAFEYFPDGLVKNVQTGDGQQHSFTYDAAGRRDSATDTAGNRWRFQY